MIRIVVGYTEEPDPARYEQHLDVVRKVGDLKFRQGKVLRTLSGQPELKWFAELEFPDMETFQRIAQTDDFKAIGVDAAEMGYEHSVYLVEINE